MLNKFAVENNLLLRSFTKLLIAILFSVSLATLQGCTGVFTGHQYSKKDLIPIYQVIKNGVTTFMTQEEIEKAKLDKIDIVVTDTYKLVNPSDYQQVNQIP